MSQVGDHLLVAVGDRRSAFAAAVGVGEPHVVVAAGLDVLEPVQVQVPLQNPHAEDRVQQRRSQLGRRIGGQRVLTLGKPAGLVDAEDPTDVGPRELFVLVAVEPATFGVGVAGAQGFGELVPQLTNQGPVDSHQVIGCEVLRRGRGQEVPAGGRDVIERVRQRAAIPGRL